MLLTAAGACIDGDFVPPHLARFFVGELLELPDAELRQGADSAGIPSRWTGTRGACPLDFGLLCSRQDTSYYPGRCCRKRVRVFTLIGVVVYGFVRFFRRAGFGGERLQARPRIARSPAVESRIAVCRWPVAAVLIAASSPTANPRSNLVLGETQTFGGVGCGVATLGGVRHVLRPFSSPCLGEVLIYSFTGPLRRPRGTTR